MPIQAWQNIQQGPAWTWACGHCGQMVGGNMGYFKNDPKTEHKIYICPACEKPTYWDGGKQVPGVAYGDEVDKLPADVAGLYKEARNCISVSAYTASTLATRKLLMNVAVSQGAPGNDTFQNYVSFLQTKGYVPPNAKGWVDHIRNKGNEATHEIPPISQADAQDLITFMEMILKLVFEFPNRIPGHPSVATGS